MDFGQASEAVRAGADPWDTAAAFVAGLTPDERLWCLDGDLPFWAGLGFLNHGGYHRAAFPAGAVDRVGLPGIRFADGPRGAVIGNGTSFPVSMARGATWDPALEERIGEAIGRELRAAGANLTGAVCINVLRHPAWGRAQETYGEDPFLVGEFGAAFTRGLQRYVMACVKHFACNSMENARFSVDVQVDEVALHDVFLPHFRRVVDEGVAAVMSAYNSVNGEWCGQNPELLTDVLRGEWGFEGFVISDFILGLRDAGASLRAGMDVEMPFRMVRAERLRPALDAGEVTWADVDRAVTRVVATLLRFDTVLSAPDPDASVVGCASHRALAREAASRAVVLLRNEPVDGRVVLPLARDARVAVIGALAATVNTGDHGSSDVWDDACVTVLDGLRAALDHVVHDDGSDLTRAASVAAAADVAVVVVGYTAADEGEYIGPTAPELQSLFPPKDAPEAAERFAAWVADVPPARRPSWVAPRSSAFGVGGDRRSLGLSEAHVALIRAVAAANPRVVVAVQAGSAVVVHDWVDDVPALVQAWYGGAEAGPALADVLTGAVPPSGRLPFSVPVAEADLPPFDADATSFRYDEWHGWWHLRRNGARAQFPFGFGLSYTSFELGDATAEVDDGAGSVTFTGTVRNVGPVDGTDVVQVYATLPDPAAPPRLVGFDRVDVPAGSTRPFAVTVPFDRLRRRDPQAHEGRVVAGVHRFTVGRHAEDDGIVFAVEVLDHDDRRMDVLLADGRRTTGVGHGPNGNGG